MNTAASSYIRKLFWFLAALSLPAATSLAGDEDPDDILPREAIVRLLPGASIDDFNIAYGSATLRSIPLRNIHLILTPEGVPEDQFEMLIDQDPNIVWAELGYEADAPEGNGRNFFFSETPIALEYSTQRAWQQLGLGQAHNVATGDGAVVAIVDSGIDTAHPALALAIAPGGANLVDGGSVADVGDGLDTDGDLLIDEMTGHGTHVAGIIAFIAPHAGILPVKVLDSDGNTSTFTLAAGIFHAIDAGATVINVSIGTTYRSDVLEDAVAEAAARGIPVIAASGNLNRMQPEEYPAMLEGAIAVTSVSGDDIRSDFSNYNQAMAVSGPGEAIFSTIPGGLYAAWDGTSMAAPMAAGTAALLISQHPEWPADGSRVAQVRSLLQQGADNVDPLNPGFEGLIGAGRVNAARALTVRGAFAAPQTYATAPAPSGVALIHADDDDRADAAVISAGGALQVFTWNAGTLAVHQTLSLPSGPAAVVGTAWTTGEAEHLVSISENANSYSVTSNLGDGTFAPPVNRPCAAAPQAIVAADFDGDGLRDLAIAAGDGDAVFVIRALGDGAVTPVGTYPVGRRPRGLTAGDVDRDGDVDIVTADSDDQTVSILRNTGTGAFAPAEALPAGNDPRGVALLDLNGDGAPELAVADHGDAAILVFSNDGAGVFTPAASLSTAPADPNALCTADLNCDGAIDLAVAAGDVSAALIQTFLNRGDGTLGVGTVVVLGAEPSAIAAADIDADGDVDLAAVSDLNGTLSVVFNETCVAYAHGDMNCDGAIDNGDIDGFVLALFDPAGYADVYPGCRVMNADTNHDRAITNGDIDSFVACLLGACP